MFVYQCPEDARLHLCTFIYLLPDPQTGPEEWLQATVDITNTAAEFQIAIVAAPAVSDLFDLAIDDVMIEFIEIIQSEIKM